MGWGRAGARVSWGHPVGLEYEPDFCTGAMRDTEGNIKEVRLIKIQRCSENLVFFS